MTSTLFYYFLHKYVDTFGGYSLPLILFIQISLSNYSIALIVYIVPNLTTSVLICCLLSLFSLLINLDFWIERTFNWSVCSNCFNLIYFASICSNSFRFVFLVSSRWIKECTRDVTSVLATLHSFHYLDEVDTLEEVDAELDVDALTEN